MLGAFLIPIGVSSLRGLTHVVTCREATNVPFSVSLPPTGAATVSSATSFTRDETTTLCGGLALDMRVGRVDADTVRITLPITNSTRNSWQGTVKLNLGQTSVPVRIGKIPAGKTSTETIKFNVDPGTSEIGGSLLIGP